MGNRNNYGSIMGNEALGVISIGRVGNTYIATFAIGPNDGHGAASLSGRVRAATIAGALDQITEALREGLSEALREGLSDDR